MVVADQILNDGSNDPYDFYDIKRKTPHKHKVIESSDEDDGYSGITENPCPLQSEMFKPIFKEEPFKPKAKVNKTKFRNRDTNKTELHSKTQEIIRNSRINFPYEKGPKFSIAQIKNGEIDKLIMDGKKIVKTNKIRDLLIMNSPSVDLAIFNDLNIFDKSEISHNIPAPIFNVHHSKNSEIILEPSPEIPYVKMNKKGHTHENEHTNLETLKDDKKDIKLSKRKLDFSSYFSKNKFPQDEVVDDNFDLMSMKSLTSLVSLDSRPSDPIPNVKSIINDTTVKPSLAKCEMTNPNGCIEFEIELETNEKDFKINKGVNTLVNRFVKHTKYKTPDIKRKDKQSPKDEIKLNLVQDVKNKRNTQFPQCKGMKLEMLQKSLLPMMQRKRQESFEKRVQAYNKYKVMEEKKCGTNEGTDNECDESDSECTDMKSIEGEKLDTNEVKAIDDPFTRKCTDDFSYGEGSFSSNKVVSSFNVEASQSCKDLFATNATFPPPYQSIGVNNFDENTNYYEKENRFACYQEDSMELPEISLNPFKNERIPYPKNSSSSHDIFDGLPNQSREVGDDSELSIALTTPSGPSQDVFAIPETAIFGINEDMDGLEEAKFLCSGIFSSQRLNEDILINHQGKSQPDFGFEQCYQDDESQMSLVEKVVEHRDTSHMDSMLVEESEFIKADDNEDSWDGVDKKKKATIKIVESDDEMTINSPVKHILSTDASEESEDGSDEEENEEEGVLEAESEGEIEEEDEELKEFYVYEKSKKNDYIEDEAELSGEDVGVNDENEEEEDDYEIDDEAEALGIEEIELNEQVGKIHRKVTLEQDKKEIRALQEIFFEDGDDPANQTQRVRRFKWNFEDDNSASSFTKRNTRFSSPEPDQNSNEADDKNDASADQSPDTEGSRRRLRFERSQFMDSLQRQNSELLFMENSGQEGESDLQLDDSNAKSEPFKPFSSLFPIDPIMQDVSVNDTLCDSEDMVIQSQVKSYQTKVTP